MNRRLKLVQSEKSRVYITSDTHLNHDPKWEVPLWEARGHTSSKDHTDFIINTINGLVRPEDSLIHLGDFCLNTSEAGLEELLSRIHCQTIYMLWGNHNNPLWKVYRREVLKALNGITQGYVSASLDGWHKPEDLEVYPFRYRNIVFLGNYIEVIIDGQLYVMEHYPVHVFNEMKHGVFHLCGHSHYGLDFSQATNLQNKILDVGWDGWKKPYTTAEIAEIMAKKQVFVTSDHHRDE